MPPLLQHIVALTLVAACVGYIGWQVVKTLRGKRSGVGNCCSKGCGQSTPTESRDRIIYVPVGQLKPRRR